MDPRISIYTTTLIHMQFSWLFFRFKSKLKNCRRSIEPVHRRAFISQDKYRCNVIGNVVQSIERRASNWEDILPWQKNQGHSQGDGGHRHYSK